MKQIASIQVLRAIAALMIVMAHAQDDAYGQAIRLWARFVKWDALPWDAGVDLFFVISGFIMVHASRSLFAAPHAAGIFLRRRLVRIVPLYWIITTIAVGILAVVALHGDARQPFPGLDEIASSFAFLPFGRPGDGAPRPLAAQGWTLNYEMFFYVVFAAFIGFRRGVAIAGVSLALVVAVLLGALFHPTSTAIAYWSDPIILEFAIGMGIAVLYADGVRVPTPISAGLVVVGLSVLALDLAGMSHVANFAAKPNGFARLFACGAPMAVVFAAVVLRRGVPPRQTKALAAGCLLGDASYALYLFHPLMIVLTRKAYLATGLDHSLGFWPLILADLPIAALLALAIHTMVETPIHKRLSGWLRGSRTYPLDRSLPSTPGR